MRKLKPKPPGPPDREILPGRVAHGTKASVPTVAAPLDAEAGHGCTIGEDDVRGRGLPSAAPTASIPLSPAGHHGGAEPPGGAVASLPLAVARTGSARPPPGGGNR